MWPGKRGDLAGSGDWSGNTLDFHLLCLVPHTRPSRGVANVPILQTEMEVWRQSRALKGCKNCQQPQE